MRLNRFFIQSDLSTEFVSVSDESLVSQIRSVLRMEVGDFIILADGNFKEVKAKIIKLEKKSIDFEIKERWLNQNEPKVQVTLFCAILKKENFELVVQKATELGVRKIVPVLTRRTIKLGLNLERLRKIIKEASEQSGRGIIPGLTDPVEFESALGLSSSINLFLDTSEGEVLSKLDIKEDKIGVWVGPEGGWDPEEVSLALKYGHIRTSLGKLVLRAETAAIAGVSRVISYGF